MPSDAAVLSLAAMLATTAPAQGAGWELQAKNGDHGAVLTLNAGEPVSYRFECTRDDVIATETGVTKMIDLKTGKPIEDGPSAVMPAGAAVMALAGGKGDPQFMPAEAAKNPAGGWDLTIHLAKDDKQIKAIRKAEMMSLFTTGYTMAVMMDGAARAKWAEFMQRCQTAV